MMLPALSGQVLKSPAVWIAAGAFAVFVAGAAWGEKRYADGRLAAVEQYEDEARKTEARLLGELRNAQSERNEATRRAREIEARISEIQRTDYSDAIREAAGNSRCADLGPDFLRVFNKLQSRHFDGGGDRAGDSPD